MKILPRLLLLLLVCATGVFAHQPRMVDRNPVAVEAPEVSKGYYDELPGSPRRYLIESREEFTLYLNLLVPASGEQPGRFSASVYDINASSALGTLVATLDGSHGQWERFYEPFAGDTYLKGPEFEKAVPAGNYLVEVTGNENKGKYVLAIGKKEEWPFTEIVNALQLIPVLKRHFFNVSPVTFAASIFGGAYLAAMLVIGFGFGFLYRHIHLTAFESNLTRNIGALDRFVRLLLACGLLGAGLFTWSPFVLFFSGFLFFEAFAGWCALYALIGKSTCPGR